MSHPEPRRAGLTLIEVLVALVVTAIVVLTGRVIADQLSLSSRATTGALDARLAELEREHELRRSARLVSASLDTLSSFDGGRDRMEFSTRCTVPRGWDEPCRCRFDVQRTNQPVALVRACSAGFAPDTLLLDASGISLRYLVDAGSGGRWLEDWGRSSSPPIAIGIVRVDRGDTLIVRIGPRG